MSKKVKFSVATLVANVPVERQLSQELCNFLLEGQPGVDASAMLGSAPFFLSLSDPFRDTNSDYDSHEVTSIDLLNLTHARSNYEDFELNPDPRQRERAHSIYSLQLAKLLPVGHPYRRAHGIIDEESQVLRWLISDPDLGLADRQLIEDTLLVSDPNKRAKGWPLLLEAKRSGSWAWHDLRATLFANIVNRGDAFLESLHPREAGVLRSIASGMSPESIAEKFGVETARIVMIYAEAGEKFRREFSAEVNVLQDCIEKLGIVTLEHLAGLARDLDSEGRVQFIFTRLLLKFCSGRYRQGPTGAVHIFSNDAFEEVAPL